MEAALEFNLNLNQPEPSIFQSEDTLPLQELHFGIRDHLRTLVCFHCKKPQSKFSSNLVAHG